jgi:DNA-binding beta-propeller fold protein YncE
LVTIVDGRWLGRLGLLAVTVVIVAAAPVAQARDRIYWANYNGNSISFANLDGSGGGTLATGSATDFGPMGMAIDSAGGRIYWANWGLGPNGDGKTISYANLNGTGGKTLLIDPALVNGPHGLAIDSETQRLYWPNFATSTISYANLDGSGGGNLKTGGATVNGPRGIAIDPKTRRIYWANWSGNRISWAKLNGEGGGDLATGSATVNQPEGVALDPATNRIYWSAFGAADKISYANLNGSDGGDLATGSATVNGPHGIAIDPAARRIYWPNSDANSISFASLDGSGGSNLATPGVPISEPDQPVLLEAPRPAGKPQVKGTGAVGSRLRCRARWAPDLPGSLLYRGPQRLSYRWTRNGSPLHGGHAGSIRASRVGRYRCRVSGRNAAGRSSQTSRSQRVSG